ncbi:hypothetical protein [Planotetraspora sp. GP83]|uniref:hypothetical protein n=1 Tax=Planotetraspora sp. GP83 TaxID=3156264 RepID=UPI0035180FCD
MAALVSMRAGSGITARILLKSGMAVSGLPLLADEVLGVGLGDDAPRELVTCRRAPAESHDLSIEVVLDEHLIAVQGLDVLDGDMKNVGYVDGLGEPVGVLGGDAVG